MKSRKIIAGVDEVGRGSLIGSVYSAAVILPDHGSSLKLKDSKKLSEKSRVKLANSLIKESVCISIGIATKDEIDSINIHHATLLSMKRAVYNLNIEPDLVLVDGLYQPEVGIDCESIVQGDSKVEQISAASIIAKVARDYEMNFLHDKFEMYNFKKNNGYGTRQHLEAIQSLGKTIYHRESFVK
ncbi:MAG: ribonuclease HII [Pseudomonadota bacterium]|jgi:ribonuclease HII|nr:ribonuclease HII [Pseudomonadota bacterium]